MSGALALAFSAGMVATLNPCGFAMLPAYLSYFMGIRDEEPSPGRAMGSALVVGGIVSAGFLLVFGLAGIVITGISRSLAAQWIPWLALLVGVAVALLGVALLLGYELRVGLPKTKRAGKGRGFGNVFGFGTSYAVASLSCTLPVFLTVVATQITQRSFIAGVAIFFAYAAGMATVLLGITVVLALGKQSIVGRLRASARHINRISGVILVAAGAWIVWFWSTALASGAGALGQQSSFRFVEDLSQRSLNFIADHTVLVAVAFGAIIAAAAAYAWRSRGKASPRSALGEGPHDGTERETVGVSGGGTEAG